MYKICMILFTLTVTDLVESMSTGNVRSRSPSRRLIFDTNHKFTGWKSWEQYAACSTRCVSGYENETKKCCESGDNRLCYNLPWNILKMFVGTCPNLVESMSTGNVRSRSPSRRLIFDTNHKFTGWASWEQYAACSTRCVSGYENETKKCCESGDNRLCYNLPWNILKMFVGTCPNSTTTLQPTRTKSTTAVRTSTSTTARPTRAATTIQRPKTLPPITTECAVCSGPPVLCEQLYATSTCPPPNNYCINTITNHIDGTRTVNRSCGNFNTCYREWFLRSSDNDRCQQFDENYVHTLEFKCTYCCIKDNCNVPLRPSDSSLYQS